MTFVGRQMAAGFKLLSSSAAADGSGGIGDMSLGPIEWESSISQFVGKSSLRRDATSLVSLPIGDRCERILPDNLVLVAGGSQRPSASLQLWPHL